MNAERLHVIVLAIHEDLQETNSITHINNIESNLGSQISNPSEPSYQENVSKTLTELFEALENSSSNEFSPGWKQTLEELGIDNLFGMNLKVKLQEIFERNQITPSVALGEIKEIHNNLNQLNQAITKIIESFEYLEIGAEELEPGECELGILIPRDAVKNKLEDFAEELDDLNRILNTFSELATGTRQGFELRTISSTDLNVYLQSLPAVAALIAVAVERIINVYKHLLEIRKLRQELLDQKVPKEALSDLDKHANSMMEKGIEELTNELIKKNKKIKDSKRKNELTNELRITLRQIATRIDKGYNIEVRVEPFSEDEEEEDTGKVSPEDQKYIQTIISSSQTLQFMNLEGEPILSLPEPNSSTKKKIKNDG